MYAHKGFNSRNFGGKVNNKTRTLVHSPLPAFSAFAMKDLPASPNAVAKHLRRSHEEGIRKCSPRPDLFRRSFLLLGTRCASPCRLDIAVYARVLPSLSHSEQPLPDI